MLDSSTALVLSETFHVFHEALSKTNITYFIMGGSLIGSYRHHNIIPWDDDIDVIVNSTQRMMLHEILLSLEPDYLHTWSMEPLIQWKFYPTNGQ